MRVPPSFKNSATTPALRPLTSSMNAGGKDHSRPTMSPIFFMKTPVLPPLFLGTAVFALPPCGGGLGRGVLDHLTPTLTLPHQGGGIKIIFAPTATRQSGCCGNPSSWWGRGLAG